MNITIIGSGKVGAYAALSCGLRELGNVLLLDIVKGLPQGEAMDINHQLAERGSDCIIRGSNNYEDMRASDIVIVVTGMGGMLDLSRFKNFIQDTTKVSRQSIQALVIGEHGENMLPLIRFSSIGGIPLSQIISKEQAQDIFEHTKKV